jgi:hypothetical protein
MLKWHQGLKLLVSTINTVVKNCKETERRYVLSGPFSEQKSLKHLLQKKLESALTAWFKQARDRNASIDGTHHKERALHIAAYLERANFFASNGWIDRFKRRHNIVYSILSGEGRSVDSENCIRLEKLPTTARN